MVGRPVPDSGAEPRRIPELDGIRGCAILLVLFWHYVVLHIPGLLTGRIDSPLARAWPLLSLSWSGVDLFFVLSGFLIGGILLDNHEQPAYFRTFYLRRLLRIAPLYALFLLVSGGLMAGPLSSPRFAWLTEHPFPAWTYAALVQNFWMAAENRFGPNLLGITWSLAVEEQFYLVLPLLIRFVPLHRLPYLLVAAIMAAPGLRFVFTSDTHAESLAAYVLLPCRADALLLGVLGAYFLRTRGEWLRSERCRVLLRLLLGLGAVVVVALAYRGAPNTIGYRWMSVLGHSFLAVAYTSILLLAVVESSGTIAVVLRLRLLRTLGTLAYGLYLFHQGVSGLLHALLRNQAPHLRTPEDALVTLASLGLTLGLAHLSWRWLEQPCVALGHALRYGDGPQKPD